MPGLVGAFVVGLGYNAYVWYRRRVHGENRHTTSSAIRQIRTHWLGDAAYKALSRHWSNV